jgi:CSLREA domain-containing protein
MKTYAIRCLVLAALLANLLPSAVVVHAANLTVNSLADTVAADGNCTLREAIQNANSNAATNADCAAGSGADIIAFGVSGTITLGSILPAITDAAGLILDGAGQAVTISGNNAARVAVVQNGASLTLSNLTIANGSTIEYGGGVLNGGILVVADSVFSGNSASSYGGGAIYNRGSLTISNSTFSGNSASWGGGGVYNDGGAFTIANSVFSGNSASGGRGGAMYIFSGSVTITDSLFTSNSASQGSGGAIYNDVGTLTIANSSFSGNSANWGNGGGIYNNYSITVKLSTFADNSAGSGGGICNSGAYLTVANSTFSGNSASAGGVNGGGIFNIDHGGLTVLSSTFSGNSAPGSGGGIGNASGRVTLRNTIVANSISGGNCAGAITNGGSNLEDSVTCGWGDAAGSLSNANPLLGALAGSPAYFPLAPGSPAIDAGDDPHCAAAPVTNQSQNGLTRPQGAHCDIGSYESAAIATPTSTPTVTQTGTPSPTNTTTPTATRIPTPTATQTAAPTHTPTRTPPPPVTSTATHTTTPTRTPTATATWTPTRTPSPTQRPGRAQRVQLPMLLRNYGPTSVPAPPCPNDPYEPNGTFDLAWGPLPLGADFLGYFNCPADTDRDFYFFDLTADQRVAITLQNVPAGSDYDLMLYSCPDASCRIGFSGNPGNADERIEFDGAAGRHYVRVTRSQASPLVSQAYWLRVAGDVGRQ